MIIFKLFTVTSAINSIHSFNETKPNQFPGPHQLHHHRRLRKTEGGWRNFGQTDSIRGKSGAVGQDPATAQWRHTKSHRETERSALRSADGRGNSNTVGFYKKGGLAVWEFGIWGSAKRVKIPPTRLVKKLQKKPSLSFHLTKQQTSTRFPQEVKAQVTETRRKIKKFTDDIRNGVLKGATGKVFKNVISVGIGGSYLGVECVFEALRTEGRAMKAAEGRRLRFLANVDPIDVRRALEGFDPAETLVIVVSKHRIKFCALIWP